MRHLRGSRRPTERRLIVAVATRWTRWTAAFLLLAITAMGCASPSDRGETQSTTPRVQRNLVVSTGRLLTQLGAWGLRDDEARDVVSSGLVQRNLTNLQWQGWMAEDLPSLEKGTLQLNPDGTMVATWKLRPNIKWHDGTAFDSSDLSFSLELAKDPNLPITERAFPDQVDRVETPDSQTWVVYLNRVHLAGRITNQNYLSVVPRHILEPLYRAGEYTALENHPYWTSGFIGAGPYRVLDFLPAEVLEVEAFDDYFLGRPKIDRITWRLVGDRQVMLANILTNSVDVTLRDALTWDGALVAKEQWEGTGQGTVLLTPTNAQGAGPGMNPIFEDVRVRQALLHAINRDEIKETLSRGLIEVAYIPMVPGFPSYARVLSAATRYEFDPQRARSLLQDAGWTRGTDGVLTNQRGDRFAIDFEAASGADLELLQAPVADYWRAIGVETQINNMPQRALDTEEFRNRWPGVRMVTVFSDPGAWDDRYHSRFIPTEANRWLGQNTGRWANPEKDRTLADLFSAHIRAPNQVEDLYVRFAQLYTQDLPQWPIRYTVESTTYRTGLTGVYPKYGGASEYTRTWNIHLWEWTTGS